MFAKYPQQHYSWNKIKKKNWLYIKKTIFREKEKMGNGELTSTSSNALTFSTYNKKNKYWRKSNGVKSEIRSQKEDLWWLQIRWDPHPEWEFVHQQSWQWSSSWRIRDDDVVGTREEKIRVWFWVVASRYKIKTDGRLECFIDENFFSCDLLKGFK